MSHAPRSLELARADVRKDNPVPLRSASLLVDWCEPVTVFLVLTPTGRQIEGL